MSGLLGQMLGRETLSPLVCPVLSEITIDVFRAVIVAADPETKVGSWPGRIAIEDLRISGEESGVVRYGRGDGESVCIG
ncbi:MAG: hypothetical protein ACRDYD_13820, partial [Acidimicrobiales bacterium]